MQVPFVDLKIQYESIKTKIDHAIQDVIDTGAFIKGKYVENFEKEFARKIGIKHCIGVGNGTDAIYIILKVLGIGPGDEVITVANSWISTSETISQTGATPVFIDIEKDLFNINPGLIQAKITKNTKAIIAVHLYGQPADIVSVADICKTNNLFLIEDCAQAHFAKFNDRHIGTFGIAGSFSFYPGKNLGAYGDAGAIITNDDDLATKVKMFANHGALIKHNHIIEGINSRLDGLQAAVLSVKLGYIHQWNKQRIKNAIMYTSLLEEIKEIQTPKIGDNATHIFHLYVIRCKMRNQLRDFLKQNGIETGIHYPTPLPLMQAYKYLNYSEGDIPVAAEYMNKILSLPMYPELSEAQINFVVNKIKEFYNII